MEITNRSIEEFLETIEEERISDIKWLVELGKRITNREANLWGKIIGFGKLHYKSKAGTVGDMPMFSFANRKNAITLYLSFDINQYEDLDRLGKFTTGKGCLYIKSLKDVDLKVLESLSIKAVEDLVRLPIITILE